MDGVILLAFGIGALILYYLRRDGAIDLKKTTTHRPVVKFRILPTVADKETQTMTQDSSSPMSLSEVSMDFPFSFNEDYLISTDELNTTCETEIDGLTGLCEIPDITIGCESDR